MNAHGECIHIHNRFQTYVFHPSATISSYICKHYICSAKWWIYLQLLSDRFLFVSLVYFSPSISPFGIISHTDMLVYPAWFHVLGSCYLWTRVMLRLCARYCTSSVLLEDPRLRTLNTPSRFLIMFIPPSYFTSGVSYLMGPASKQQKKARWHFHHTCSGRY